MTSGYRGVIICNRIVTIVSESYISGKGLFMRHSMRLGSLLVLICMTLCLFAPVVNAEPAPEPQLTDPTVTLVRRSPYDGATVIGCLEDGTVLTVLNETEYFYEIDCFDMIGYIAKHQVLLDLEGQYYVNCSADSTETKTLPARTSDQALALRGQIRDISLQYQGVPYVWGGSTPSGFDCSGFTQYVFRKAGYSITRTCLYQLADGIIVAREDLECGDLVFFENTTPGKFASHVGIYIGNGQLIHAGSKGITVVELDSYYFDYHYLCSRRVVLAELPQETLEPTTGITQDINSSYWRESSQTAPSGNSFFI